MAAYEAFPKVNPPVAGFQTLFAALGRGLYIVDLVQVRASLYSFSFLHLSRMPCRPRPARFPFQQVSRLLLRPQSMSARRRRTRARVRYDNIARRKYPTPPLSQPW